MTQVQDLDLASALRPGTLAFARSHQEPLDRKLGPAMTGMSTELRRLKGAEALMLRRNFADSQAVWERFFWARVALHRVRDGLPLDEALRYADEELLGLSAVIHPI